MSRRDPKVADLETADFRDTKNALKNVIYKSKKLKEEKLSQDVKNGGLGYKMVMR